MERAYKVGLIILAILLLVSLGFNVYSFYLLKHQEPPEVIEMHDTIFRDSILIQEKTKIKYITYHDTAVIYLHDSLTDTILVHVPIEHKMYTDTISKDSLDINLEIGYSGFEASIDSIKLSYDLHYTIPEPKDRRWRLYIGVGIQAGYGLQLTTDKAYTSPYIGVGISYGFGYCWSSKKRK